LFFSELLFEKSQAGNVILNFCEQQILLSYVMAHMLCL